jgi:rhodanese-related sulfurtransferase
MTWQYLVTPHPVLDVGNTWWEAEGATEIDVATAKSFHDRGVKFIDVSSEHVWKNGHIPGAVNLPSERNKEDPAHKRFRETALRELLGKTDEVVLYSCYRVTCDADASAWEAAKAVNWGYEEVFFLVTGTRVWAEAGYPVETAE